MKTKAILLLSCMFLHAVFTYSQENAEEFITPEKSYFQKNKSLGGDVVIKDLTYHADEKYAYAIFEVDVPEAGNYYLSAWIMGGQKGDGSYISYDILVNNKESEVKMQGKENYWQGVSADSKSKSNNVETVSLQKGKNMIAFREEGFIIPSVEYIRLSPVKEKASISEKFTDVLKKKAESQKLIEEPILRATPVAISDSQNVVYDYHYKKNFKYSYTSFLRIQPSNGKTFTIETEGSPHDISVFPTDQNINIESNSWTFRSTLQSNGKHKIILPISIAQGGMYFIMVRSQTPKTDGTVYLTLTNISTHQNNKTIFPYLLINCSDTLQITRNTDPNKYYGTFACWPMDPVILTLESQVAPHPASSTGCRVVGYNSGYTIPYPWPQDYLTYYPSPLVRKKYLTAPKIVYAHVLFSGGVTVGDYEDDLENYTGVDHFLGPTLYTHIEHDNNPNWSTGYISHSSSGIADYNCYSWAGGIVTHWYSGSAGDSTSSTLSVYGDNDQFFGNYRKSGNSIIPLLRYKGAVTYEPILNSNGGRIVDMNDGSAAIDIWSGHATICNTARDDREHGPWWESKFSNGLRTFHPRLRPPCVNSGYPTSHYKRASNQLSSVIMTMDESLAQGLSVLENPQFTEKELYLIETLKSKLTTSEKATFEAKHNASNDLMRKAVFEPGATKSKEEKQQYNDLISYTKNCGERIWPLVMEKYMKDKEANFGLLNEVFLVDNDYNTLIANSIMEYNLKNQYNEDGAYIVRSDYSNGILFIKQLLKELEVSTLRGYKASSPLQYTGLKEDIKYSNADPCTAYYSSEGNQVNMNFSIENPSVVHLVVWDSNAREIASIVSNAQLIPGSYEYSWNSSGYPAGIYFVKYVVNGNLNVKKVICK